MVGTPDGEPTVPAQRRPFTARRPDWVAADAPLVIAISGDPLTQRDLVRRIGGTAVVILVPDLDSAAPLLAMFGRSGPTDTVDDELPDGFEIDHRLRTVAWRGARLQLTDLEHELLTMMAGDLERVWTHEQLHTGVWRDSYLPHTTHLQSTVKRLRRKLVEAGVPLQIEAVRGVGYRLHRATPLDHSSDVTPLFGPSPATRRRPRC
jgi:DNA-binding winged helix-turn-helix (wHTH) protein